MSLEEKRKIKNEKSSIYYYKNHKKCLARSKKYRNNNLKEKKRCAIKTWRSRGVVSEDFNSLYDQYIQILNCENCGVDFGERGDGSCTFRVLDHCHVSGQVRNVLCQLCNIRRGYVDNAGLY